MHVLYRFYNAAGDLLYVGITNNPPRRWSEHRDQKDWWLDVARVEIEHYSSRDALARAELAAIQQESPLHNVAHASSVQRPTPCPGPNSPYRIGEVYAFRLDDGTCPVGLVTEHDDEGWLSIDLYSWMVGRFTAGEQWIDEARIFSVLHAVKSRTAGGTVFEMDRLGDYQTQWLEMRSSFDGPADLGEVRWGLWIDDLRAIRT